MVDAAARPDTAKSLLSEADAHEFLLGAAMLGIGLGSSVEYVRGDTPMIPSIFPSWAWLVGAAVFLVTFVKAESARARVADGAMAACLLCGAAATRLQDARTLLIVQSLCLGLCGAVAILETGRKMPSSLARSGMAMGIATTSVGFLAGWWKVLSAGAILGVVLVATWILDKLEADGALVRRGKREAAQQGDEADEAQDGTRSAS